MSIITLNLCKQNLPIKGMRVNKKELTQLCPVCMNTFKRTKMVKEKKCSTNPKAAGVAVLTGKSQSKDNY